MYPAVQKEGQKGGEREKENKKAKTLVWKPFGRGIGPQEWIVEFKMITLNLGDKVQWLPTGEDLFPAMVFLVFFLPWVGKLLPTAFA